MQTSAHSSAVCFNSILSVEQQSNITVVQHASFCKSLSRSVSSSAQSQVIGPSQPIVATVGDDIILPCHLEPAEDASGKTVEWTRSNLDPRFVYVWRDGGELEDKKHPSYRGRTSVFIDQLKLGDISLKLSRVKLSDEGRYKCFNPELGHSFIELVVGKCM